MCAIASPPAFADDAFPHNAGVGAYHELAVPQVSDIKYHQQSNQVLIASRHPGQDVVIWAFAPKETMADDDDDGEEPRWRLGWSEFLPQLFIFFLPCFNLSRLVLRIVTALWAAGRGVY